ncbi:thioredoxin family protein [Geoalkalibacter halelectricus]|uniref:Thioredoxin family protein n=1 Tax=Geoalkalibacter halelectricus TaxID=2847045 RepID=A0ABY5ZHP0_9BACT|nr:thioredoxin family protein [Geoalkalibacter halelectricus]UWZ78677.1 thioredoxin family protein [Geoalkalibacter halelectricus]
MRIDVLCKPDGDKRCERTLSRVRQALENLNLEAEVHLYRDQRKMIDNRVYVSPALLIDDIVRVAGRVPSIEEIERLLRERPRYQKRMKDVA